MIHYPGQNIVEILQGIDILHPAVLDDRVNNRRHLPGLGMADEQPVLLANRGRADRILDAVVIDLHFAIVWLSVVCQALP